MYFEPFAQSVERRVGFLRAAFGGAQETGEMLDPFPTPLQVNRRNSRTRPKVLGVVGKMFDDSPTKKGIMPPAFPRSLLVFPNMLVMGRPQGTFQGLVSQALMKGSSLMLQSFPTKKGMRDDASDYVCYFGGV